MPQSKNTLTASIQSKSGRLYAVIQTKKNGKAHAVWRALGLPEDTAKSKVNKVFREVVNRYEEEVADEIARAGRPDADITVFDYMRTWLESVKQEIQINTYNSYHGLIYGKTRRYFEARPEITVGNMTPKNIEEFYAHLFSGGVVSNTVIHYHAVMRRAFKQAFKDGMIDVNPFDRVDRPKKNKFHGDHYSEDEWIALLKLARKDGIYPAIMLGGGLGLRRSEALGVRWSRIDWEKKTVLLDTKIVEYKEGGEVKIAAVEEMKNKSSHRTLPLPEPVIQMLEEEREKQAMYRKMWKGSYNRSYDDYVCVNQLGDIIRPAYVTRHFADLLKKLGLRQIRFHDLRHTFASILLGKDVPLINVSNFLGHSDISTTANIYAHLDKASKQTSADIITDVWDSGKDKD